MLLRFGLWFEKKLMVIGPLFGRFCDPGRGPKDSEPEMELSLSGK